jgi:hypothetical protein
VREAAYEIKRAVIKKTFPHRSIFKRGYLASASAQTATSPVVLAHPAKNSSLGRSPL